MPLATTEFVQLVDRHAAALRALAAQWSDSPEDLVQEAYCRLAAQRTPPSNPAAWLFRVVRNLALESHRQRKRRKKREQSVALCESVHTDPANTVEGREAVEMLQLLDPQQREIVVMRLWGGLTLEDIASICGLSVATVHRRFQAALAALRERWKSPCPNSI